MTLWTSRILTWASAMLVLAGLLVYVLYLLGRVEI